MDSRISYGLSLLLSTECRSEHQVSIPMAEEKVKVSRVIPRFSGLLETADPWKTKQHGGHTVVTGKFWAGCTRFILP